MARTPKQKPAGTNIPEGIPPGHAVTLAEEKLVQTVGAYTEDRDLMNQLLGQIQMASALSKFADVVSLSKLAHIKETKQYRALSGKKGVDRDGEEIADVSTWAGFCRMIGTTHQKVDEDLLNLSAFGEEAMGNLNRIGAGYRELRKLRKLPDDVREQIVQGQLVNLTDKEEVVALIDDLAAKHATEKSALTKENADLKADHEALDKVVQDKNKKLDAQEKLIHKLQNKSGDWHPRAFEISMENTRVGASVLEGLDRLDTLRDAILNEDFGEADREAAIEAMAVVHYDTLNQIVGRLAEVMAACEEVFVGYKEKARPALDVFGNLPTVAEMVGEN